MDIKSKQTCKTIGHNRVIEINRFTELSKWIIVRSEDMIARLGQDKQQLAPIIRAMNQLGSMALRANFPMKSTAEIKLNREEITSMQQADLLKANSEEVANGYLC